MNLFFLDRLLDLETAFWRRTGAPDRRNALDSAGFHPRSSAPTSPLPDGPVNEPGTEWPAMPSQSTTDEQLSVDRLVLACECPAAGRRSLSAGPLPAKWPCPLAISIRPQKGTRLFPM